MQLPHAVGLDEDDRAGRAVAVVLRQVQYEIATRHLHVQRHAIRELVLPVDGAAEVADVELLGLLDVEDP